MKASSTKIRIIFTFILINICLAFSYSQQTTASIQQQKYVYIDPIKTCETVANKGYKSVALFQQLGNSYYGNFNFEKAAKWYGELFAMNESIEAVYYYRYAHALNCINQTEKANKYFELYDLKSKKNLKNIENKKKPI